MSRKVVLPPLPKISDILRIYGVRAKKQLSQNFILDQNITDKIAGEADVYDCFVCEVGSGPGSLTRSVLHAGARHVAAVEIDRRFIPALEMLAECSEGKMTVYNEDIMRFNVPAAFPNVEGVEWNKDYLPSVRLVGNLPFNVSIPLLLQWLQAVSRRAGPFIYGRVPMSLVFQKEVADNIVAKPGHPNCSRLSVMTQHLCEVKRKYRLPRTVFVPEPKVDAALLHIIPLKEPKIDAPYEVVEQVVKALFSMRRKFIRSSLKCLFPSDEHLVNDMLSLADLDPTMRATQVEMSGVRRLCEAFLEITENMNLDRLPLKVNRPSPVPSIMVNDQ